MPQTQEVLPMPHTKTKEWTVMFYFASDNSLASTMVSQLKALKDAGYHPDANVVAHFDPHVANLPVHVFDVNSLEKLQDPDPRIGFESNNPFVRNLVLDKLWGEHQTEVRKQVKQQIDSLLEGRPDGPKYNLPQPSREMSQEQSPRKALSGFLEFCKDHYPARHYALIILGHGQVVGDDSFLLDDNSSPHSLKLKELGTILHCFSDGIEDKGQLELVGFHSCSMSGLEVAYELAGTTNYMLASQGPAYVGSWPYKQMLIRLFSSLCGMRDHPPKQTGTAGRTMSITC